MPKVTLNKTTFELSEDSSLILQGYLSKLELYSAKGNISRAQITSIQSTLESFMLENLSTKQDITGNRMHELIESAERSAGWKLPREESSFFASLFRGIFHILASLVWLVYKFIRVFAFFFLGMVCTAIVIGLFAIIPLILLNPTIDNQVIFGALPELTRWILMTLEIGFVLLGIGFLYGIWRGSALQKNLLIFGTILVILGVNGACYIAAHIMYNYGDVYTRTSSQEITIGSGTLTPELSGGIQKKLDLSLTRGKLDLTIPLTEIDIVSGTGNTIRIDTDMRVFAANQTLANEYFDNIRPIQFILSGSTLVLDPVKNGTAIKEVNYQGLFRTIQIKTTTKPESMDK